MGYYMRYVVVDDPPPSLEELGDHLRRLDSAYVLQQRGSVAVLTYGGSPVAQLEVNTRGDDLLDQERDELIQFLEDANGPAKDEVLKTLRASTSVLAAQVLFGDRGTEAT